MSSPTGEAIDFGTYKYIFTTYATQKFLPSLDVWLNIHTRHAEAVGGKVIVWLGADIKQGLELATKWRSVEFRAVPNEAPAGSFADFWAAEHYAWKIWLMRAMVEEFGAEAKTMVIYVDAGAVTIRMPMEMMGKAAVAGTCFVEDTTQKNMYWFSDSFKRLLNVQEFEMQANQIQAATIVFVPALAKKLAISAFTMACNRDIIAGPKWAGALPSGQPFGHRHDQAIFSLLRLRHGIPVEPIEKMQNMKSMKEASECGAAFYVHRGNFVVGGAQIPEMNVINLERRADRLAKFYENHPNLRDKVRVHKATDGRAMQLTPAVARLLRPNDFFWKKAVAGCALSHLGLWNRFATAEGPSDRAAIVFEDDVKLVPDWMNTFSAAYKDAPADWDVLYLGGVLPQNWAAFETVKEPVRGPWCRVAPNQIFGQSRPTRYFHFCNYSYVISKRGAQKLLALIQARDGFFTSADHMICNHVDLLNLYFLDPKVAGCVQEQDPAYMQSQFNNYNRIDTFDSDLWTNDERWTQEEREAALNGAGALNIEAALNVVPVQAALPAERNLLVRMMNTGGDDAKKALMEAEWLEEMLNCTIWIEPMVKTSAEFKLKEVPWVIVSRQDIDAWTKVFKHFETEGRNFYAIHLSDENGKDDISWYKSPMCKGVIRNYWRADAAAMDHVIILPLGYTNGTKVGFNENSARACMWSFEGTNWFGREEKLKALEEVGPFEKKLFAKWNDPGQKSRAEYAAQLSRSVFVPIIRGNHFETFRMYEALEAGAVPIYVREAGDEEYWNWLNAHVPLANISSWSAAATYMKFFLANPEHLNKYRNGLLAFWKKWKSELRERLAMII